MQRPALIMELACFGLRKRCPFLVALHSQMPEDQGQSSIVQYQMSSGPWKSHSSSAPPG